MATMDCIASAGLTRWEVSHMPHVREVRILIMHCGLYAAYGHIRFEQRHRQLHGVPSDRIFFGPTSEIVWASYNDNRLEAMHELIVLWWFLSMATNRVIKALRPEVREWGAPM